MLSCCQTASRLRNGKNCCSLKITEGGISPRVSASPGQQNEFFHPVIPNIRDIRGAESNGDRGGNPRFPRSKVYNAGEEFVRKHRERLQRNITGARVVSSCKFTFLLPRCFATFSYSPLPSLLPPSPFFLPFYFSRPESQMEDQRQIQLLTGKPARSGNWIYLALVSFPVAEPLP